MGEEIKTLQEAISKSSLPRSVDLSRKLVAILDNLLIAGDWKKGNSLFLRKAEERLCELRDDAKRLIEQHSVPQGVENIERKQKLGEGVIKVFISLYQFDGENLQNWLNTLKTLTSYNVTRPTYRNEWHVRELINSKADSRRHAYVEVLINESDLINIDPLPVDTLGHELLVLKEGAVKIPNIVGFIHYNKKRYTFNGEKLIFERDVEI